MGYDEEIIKEAEGLAEGFLEKGSWENATICLTEE